MTTPDTTGIRLAPLEPPFSSDVAEALERRMPQSSKLPPLALFRLLVRDPALSAAMEPMGRFHLRHEPGRHSAIAPRDRELVIHRVCARCGCEYEWGVHAAAMAGRAGLTPHEVTATLGDVSEVAWSARDRALLAMVDALHDHASIDDELWAALVGHWSETQLLQLLVLAGWYHAIAYVANAARIPLESWAARFPPMATAQP
jgi:4-carboxymuconolactone decarboxylase